VVCAQLANLALRVLIGVVFGYGSRYCLAACAVGSLSLVTGTSLPPPKNPRLRLVPELYEHLGQQVLRRDGWRCQSCGTMLNLEVHHQELRSRSGDDSEQNLITLCAACHCIRNLGILFCKTNPTSYLFSLSSPGPKATSLIFTRYSETADEVPDSTTPNNAFRWDPTGQQQVASVTGGRRRLLLRLLLSISRAGARVHSRTSEKVGPDIPQPTRAKLSPP